MKLTLGPDGLAAAFRGEIDPNTLPLKELKTSSVTKKDSNADAEIVTEEGEAPPLEAVLNLHDFEAIAQVRTTQC
jgi:hypothetical protein